MNFPMRSLREPNDHLCNRIRAFVRRDRVSVERRFGRFAALFVRSSGGFYCGYSLGVEEEIMNEQQKIAALKAFIDDMWAHYRTVLENQMYTPQFIAKRDGKVKKILSI